MLLQYPYHPCIVYLHIFTYIWLISMVNVGKYTIHGSYGADLGWNTDRTRVGHVQSWPHPRPLGAYITAVSHRIWGTALFLIARKSIWEVKRCSRYICSNLRPKNSSVSKWNTSRGNSSDFWSLLLFLVWQFLGKTRKTPLNSTIQQASFVGLRLESWHEATSFIFIPGRMICVEIFRFRFWFAFGTWAWANWSKNPMKSWMKGTLLRKV